MAFDDHRLMAPADQLVPATLPQHPGLQELFDRHVDLDRKRCFLSIGYRYPEMRSTLIRCLATESSAP